MRVEVELTFLRKAEDGRFHFKTKPHARFDQFVADAMRKGVLDIRTVVFSLGSGYASIGGCYSISEEDMWVLHPHFSNYEAMLKQEQPPYEPCTEQDERANRESRTCIHCRFEYPSGLVSQLCQCEYCHRPVCMLCRRTHVTTQHAEEILRGYTGSTYTYTWQVNPGITAEGLGEIFRRFSTGGPYTRAEAARNASPKPLSRETQAAFATLGIPANASAEDIKKAFKAKALLAHPDRGGNHTEMVNLNQAKEVALRYAEKGNVG